MSKQVLVIDEVAEANNAYRCLASTSAESVAARGGTAVPPRHRLLP